MIFFKAFKMSGFNSPIGHCKCLRCSWYSFYIPGFWLCFYGKTHWTSVEEYLIIPLRTYYNSWYFCVVANLFYAVVSNTISCILLQNKAFLNQFTIGSFNKKCNLSYVFCGEKYLFHFKLFTGNDFSRSFTVLHIYHTTL